MLLAILVPNPAPRGAVYGSYPAARLALAVEVTEEALLKSPAWAADEDNQPVSARKAIKLADAVRAKLVKDDKDRAWNFDDASLRDAVAAGGTGSSGTRASRRGLTSSAFRRSWLWRS